MPISERFREQVALLVRCLPAVAVETCFALKGGSAINLFVRNLPRLSVDIDLTFLPVLPRTETLVAIEAALLRIKERLQAPGYRVSESRAGGNGPLMKLIAQQGRTQVKIEVTPVLRGCVFAPEARSVSPAVEDEFGFAEMQIVSFADLYGGKIMAALDRQHPRDLFDVRDLLANEGITDQLRQAFIVYLISHDRPITEVLCSPQKNIEALFSREFAGMTMREVTLAELTEARESLVAAIIGKMPQAHREFLVGFKRGEPDWRLLGIAAVAGLPAVRWKQQNLDKLPPDTRARLVAELEVLLL